MFSQRLVGVVVGLLGMLGASAAAAQSNSLSVASQPYTQISQSELVSLLRAEGLQAQVQTLPSGRAVIRTNVPGGGTFFVITRECANEVAQTGCELMEVAGLFGGDFPLALINDFQLQTSQVSSVTRLPTGQGYLYTKVWLIGGVGRNHLFFHIGSFLRDIDNFLQAMEERTYAEAQPSTPGEAPGLAMATVPAAPADILELATTAMPERAEIYLKGPVTRYLTLGSD